MRKMSPKMQPNRHGAYMHSTAAVDEHLADQLLLPLALAGGDSFSAVNVNMHAKTNMEVIQQFLRVQFELAQEEGCTRVAPPCRCAPV